ncbi:MAG: hypothetical protein QM765_42100 [Myxococcales bacterium]
MNPLLFMAKPVWTQPGWMQLAVWPSPRRREKLAGEKDVGELGVAIGTPGGVALLAARHLGDVQLADEVRAAGGGDDTRARGLLEQVQQLGGEEEVAQVVEGKGHLQPVGGGDLLGEDGAGVVHQHVQLLSAGLELARDAADVGLHRQVAEQHLDLRSAGGGDELLANLRGLLLVAADDGQVGAARGELQRRSLADALGGARHQEDLAFEILGHRRRSPRMMPLEGG